MVDRNKKAERTLAVMMTILFILIGFMYFFTDIPFSQAIDVGDAALVILATASLPAFLLGFWLMARKLKQEPVTN